MNRIIIAFLTALVACSQVAIAGRSVPDAKTVATAGGPLGGVVQRFFDEEMGVVCYFYSSSAPSCVKVAEPTKKPK